MATTIKTFINAKFLEDTQTTQFTATQLTIIDKITLTNITNGSLNFSANICDSSEVAQDSNTIIKNHLIGAYETYDCFELTGQVLEIGSFISMIASASDSIVIKIDGREIS